MSITPHIVVQGAERAVAFYRDAFGAEEVSRIPVRWAVDVGPVADWRRSAAHR
jgi:uncharacterized glyoxalase superfamily protein PhnB